MPVSVIKSKQRYAAMTDQEFHTAHKDKSEEDLRSMAWRHGHGKDSNHYVAKHKRGQETGSQASEAFNASNVNATHAADVKAHHNAELKKKADAGDENAKKRMELIKKSREAKTAEFNSRMDSM
jgi:hypothetical protein